MLSALCEAYVNKLLPSMLIVVILLWAPNIKTSERHVELSRRLPDAQADTVVVLEFLHAAALTITAYCQVLIPGRKRLPSDVIFEKTPVMFDGDWDVDEQLFITLKIMSVEDDRRLPR